MEFDSLRNSYKFIEKKVSEDKKDTLACMGYCYFSNDSLKIIVSLGLFSEDEFSISIKNQEAEVKFSLYNYENKTLRKTIKSKSSNSIKINSIIKNFILSNYPKKAGDTFYAKATLISDDFFVEDADFKGGFINIRPTIDFIFKLRVIILPK